MYVCKMYMVNVHVMYTCTSIYVYLYSCALGLYAVNELSGFRIYCVKTLSCMYMYMYVYTYPCLV